MKTTSGNAVIAFGTAESIPLEESQTPALFLRQKVLHPNQLSPTKVEAVTEAQINALPASHQTHRPASNGAPEPKATSTSTGR